MNSKDMLQFRQLCESPIRSVEREEALRKWEEYKLARQAQIWGRSKKVTVSKKKNLTGIPDESAIWTKLDYITSGTVQAIDLRGAELNDICVGYADLRGALLDRVTFGTKRLAWCSLKGAKLENASLRHAQMADIRLLEADMRIVDLTDANLRSADLSGANLMGADLREADLEAANLSGANLAGANLTDANLQKADLSKANMVGAELTGCNLDGARVYGVAAWDLNWQPKSSKDLIVTPEGMPALMVDDIRVAQFIYLLLDNSNIRDIIDTIGKKSVLILGRFTPERKKILDSLRERLRQLDYAPIMFDFEGAKSRDFTETVKILAGMSRFIIADITNPKSSPLELQASVPDYMVPFIPIIQDGEDPFSMFVNLQNKYDWVMDLVEYADSDQLIAVVEPVIIQPALRKESELMARKTTKIRKIHARDFL